MVIPLGNPAALLTSHAHQDESTVGVGTRNGVLDLEAQVFIELQGFFVTTRYPAEYDLALASNKRVVKCRLEQSAADPVSFACDMHLARRAVPVIEADHGHEPPVFIGKSSDAAQSGGRPQADAVAEPPHQQVLGLRRDHSGPPTW
jgi:hypothetical protein